MNDGVCDALTVEAIEDDVFEGDGFDRVELIREPLRGECEPALDDAVAGEAGEVDIHAARVDRDRSSQPRPECQDPARTIPTARVAGRTTGLGVRCGRALSGEVGVGGPWQHDMTHGA